MHCLDRCLGVFSGNKGVQYWMYCLNTIVLFVNAQMRERERVGVGRVREGEGEWDYRELEREMRYP